MGILQVDPEDPVQTVENMFDFSFLIKVTYRCPITGE
jgi:hypothetical protein